MKLVDHSKKYKYEDGSDRPDEKIIPFLDNEFVTGFKEDRIFYSKDFDIALYKKIHDEGMTYVQAYNALGFDTNILGEDRAYSAGKRVMQKARDNKLFTVDETNYDGSVSREQMGNLTPEEERAYLVARNHYLEEMLLAQKKNPIRIGGVLYLIEEKEIRADRFVMVDSFINKQKSKLNGYNVSQCLRMFGVSDSGYYAWKGRKEDIFGKQAEKKADRDAIKELMRRIIIARNGVVPGKRTFRVELFRRFGRTVNTKKIAVLMAEMNIQAQMPHKDAYKHQASHNHVCAAPVNAVNQNFFIAPRRVILSDITYLYYGEYRTTFYLCVFRDAYTRENLGWSIGRYMSLKLVEEAYRDMMSGHAGELAEVMRTNEVYVHHDQGSQYLATSFTELLHDDGFVQSVSARGNSQDNAPMESFFGRLKTAILDMVAMCRDFTSARQLVDGYLKAYNSEHYQYDLAGLTPEEFYQYATTGVYPLDNYFGVPASIMMTGGDLKKVRRRYADEEAAARREASQKHREEKRLVDPEKVILRDQRLLKSVIDKWKDKEMTASNQITKMQAVLEKAKSALQFIKSLTEDKRSELKEPLAWRKYTELSYVFMMNELF